MVDYYYPLEPGKFYHVFNHGNGKDNLFYYSDNYKFFLRRYDHYLSGFVETYAFSLMPNHFHLLVRVKEKDEVIIALQKFKEENQQDAGILKVPPFEKVAPLGTVPIISTQFRFLFASYSMAINKQQKRMGSLFIKRFKRLQVGSPRYFASLVFYIHSNPQRHGIIDDFRQYPWSSFDKIINGKPSKLSKEKVIDWFKNKDNYLHIHSTNPDLDDIKHLMIE